MEEMDTQARKKKIIIIVVGVIVFSGLAWALIALLRRLESR